MRIIQNEDITMKNNLSILWVLIIIVCAVVFAAGCNTYTSQRQQMSHQNWGVFGEIVVPVKDFEAVGLVFTEVQFQTAANGTINGTVFTYQSLLKEAQKVGAHAIVNVTIDRVTQTQSSATTAEFTSTSTRTETETWYGSALAIKYTDALKQENRTEGPLTVSPSRQPQLDSGTSASSSEQSLPPSSGRRTGF